MGFKKYYLLLLLMAMLFQNCSTSQKILALKPEPSVAAPLKFAQEPSYIAMPISIKLKDIENATNRALNGLIYEDSIVEDDNIAMKIWKQGPVVLSNFNGKIKTVFPIKIALKYRVGTSTMGVNLYKTNEFNLNGNLNLLSEVSLTNWKLHTKSEIETIDWVESPTMLVLGKNVPITYLATPALKIFKNKIAKKVDEAIENAMDFKPNVLDALEKISKPIKINEAYETWLTMHPQEIYSTSAKLKNEDISLKMGIKCLLESEIGEEPKTKFDRKKVVLKATEDITNNVQANIIAVSPYAQASKIMMKNFEGQEFGSGKQKITIKTIEIWHKNGKMVVALGVEGSVSGTLYLNGVPKYNVASKEIYFEDLEYALDTKNRLTKIANWLAQGIILKKIKENCRYSIATNLTDAQKEIATYLKNYSPMPGVFVNGKTEPIVFQNIQLTNEAIVAFLKVNGNISVAVDGFQ